MLKWDISREKLNRPLNESSTPEQGNGQTKALSMASSEYKPFHKPDVWCLVRGAKLFVSMNVNPQNRNLISEALDQKDDIYDKESGRTKAFTLPPPEYKPFDKPDLWSLDREVEILPMRPRNRLLQWEAHFHYNNKSHKESNRTKAFTLQLPEYKPFDKPDLWCLDREVELLVSVHPRNRQLKWEDHGQNNDKNHKGSKQTKAFPMPLIEYKPFDKPNLQRLDREELLVSMYVPSHNQLFIGEALGHNVKNVQVPEHHDSIRWQAQSIWENDQKKDLPVQSTEYKPFDKPNLWRLDRVEEPLVSMYLRRPRKLNGLLVWEEALGHNNDKTNMVQNHYEPPMRQAQSKWECNQTKVISMPSPEYNLFEKPKLWGLDREAELLVLMSMPPQNRQLIHEALGSNEDENDKAAKVYKFILSRQGWSKWRKNMQPKAFPMSLSQYKTFFKPGFLDRESESFPSMCVMPQNQQLPWEALGHNKLTYDKVGIAREDDATKPMLGASVIENSHHIHIEEDDIIGDHEAHSRNNACDDREVGIAREDDATKPMLGTSEIENFHYLHIEEDDSIGDHEPHSRNDACDDREVGIADENNDSTEPILGYSETENFYYIDIDEEGNSIGVGDHEAHGRTIGPSRKMDLAYFFAFTNFILELPATAIDQLSSVQKPQYALAGMLMSFAAIFICIVELVYKGRKERVSWRWKGTLPWFYYASASGMPFGTLTEIIGLACALCQSIVTTINYAFCRQHADNPIKTSVWPVIFALGLLCSKFLNNPGGRAISS